MASRAQEELQEWDGDAVCAELEIGERAQTSVW
jgi:hypothetical protein